MNLEERFWGKADKGGGPDACWPWTAKLTKAGYGRFSVGGKMAKAHRVAFTLEKGYIPPGWLVLHSCDNPACCNPAHLTIGTTEDNVLDKVLKGRQATGEKCAVRGERNGSRLHPERRPRGDWHWQAKLTAAQVAEIRAAYAGGGISQTELAKRFGVEQTTISRVVRGEIWKNTKEER